MAVATFIDCGKVPGSWKISTTVANFRNCWNVFWLCKSPLTGEKFFDCAKVPWLLKSFLIVEKFLHCDKPTFLTTEKIIGQVILKANTDVETIKTYALNLGKNLVHLPFFEVDKINIIFSRNVKHILNIVEKTQHFFACIPRLRSNVLYILKHKPR